MYNALSRRFRVAQARQLAVCGGNRLGALDTFAQALSDAKVNAVAFRTTAETGGPPQFVVDSPRQAMKALQAAARLHPERSVLRVEPLYVPGARESFAGNPGAREINITCGCATGAKGWKKSNTVLVGSDVEKVIRVQ